MKPPVVSTYDEYLRTYQPETWWADLLVTDPGRAGEIAGERAIKEALAAIREKLAGNGNRSSHG